MAKKDYSNYKTEEAIPTVGEKAIETPAVNVEPKVEKKVEEKPAIIIEPKFLGKVIEREEIKIFGTDGYSHETNFVRAADYCKANDFDSYEPVKCTTVGTVFSFKKFKK